MRKQLCGGFILYVAFLFMQATVTKSSNVIYCYWGTWSHYRPGIGEFRVNDIDPYLCTHIGYAFFGIDDDYKIKSLRPDLDFDLSNIAKTVALKNINPNLKVLASVGGGSEGSVKYSAMASTASRRQTFINSAIEFIRKNGFDGLDMDWEHPAQGGGSPDDRQNFIALLSELNAALKAHGLLLTTAVAVDGWSARISYDIPNIARHVDLINMMAYDFSGPWKSTVGFNAPLTGSGNENIKASINNWLQNGAPASKLVLGLGFYGRSFTLADSNQKSPGSPTLGGGNPGPISHDSGVLIYTEICTYLKTGNWNRQFDAEHLVPFAVKGNQWVGYDDKESLQYKIAYLKSLNLAGAMIWTIDFDDFRGVCGEKYPLLNTVKWGLQ